MIRQATLDDIPAIISLGFDMRNESRYRALGYNYAKTAETLAIFIKKDFGFVVVDDQLRGFMIAICQPAWFSDDLVASEYCLYVAPEHRGGSLGVRLIKSYKEWAQGMGAKLVDAGISTTIHPDRTKKIYEAAGFQAIGSVLTAGG